MPKNIDTLLPDIRKLLTSDGSDGSFTISNFTRFSENLAVLALKQLAPSARIRPTGTVYASELGTKCLRQFHYKVNYPEQAERMSAATRFKFLYGNLIEEAVILLAKEAGHTVEYEQGRVEEVDDGVTIAGRIDAVIDGSIVDVKSTSPYGFDKMVNSEKWEDSFGYKEQLSFYFQYSQFDDHESPRFLLVDKVSGRMGTSVLTTVGGGKVPFEDLRTKATLLVEAAKKAPEDLERRGTIKHARGEILDTVCSYCAFKRLCWKDANGGVGLRVFNYSKGPTFFTNIKPSALALPGFLAKEMSFYDEEQKEPEAEAVPGATP